MESQRDLIPGTIENSRKRLSFLKTIVDPSDTVRLMIRELESEIMGYDYGARRVREITGSIIDHISLGDDPEAYAHLDDFHDVSGANV